MLDLSAAFDTIDHQILFKSAYEWYDIPWRLQISPTGFAKIQYRFGPKTNMLKLNQEKTELIIFAPKHQAKHFSDFRLKFDGTVLSDVSCVKNLGMYFDNWVIRRAAVFCTRCSLLMILLLVPYNNALP
jgi:hypothetical protein